MVPPKKILESADALVALRNNYYSRLPPLDLTRGACHSFWHKPVEDKGANHELIGRQSCKPLRQTLLQDNSANRNHGRESARRGSTLWVFDDEPVSVYGWRLDPEPELEEYQKAWLAQRMALWQSFPPEVGMPGVETVTNNTRMVALQDQTPVRELARLEALADEMYQQFITEEHCCELVGWVNGKRILEQ